jgi:hypothetical protein
MAIEQLRASRALEAIAQALGFVAAVGVELFPQDGVVERGDAVGLALAEIGHHRSRALKVGEHNGDGRAWSEVLAAPEPRDALAG